MFGRFLELGIPTRDIAASAHFYQQLGFTPLTCGDTFNHRYGVFSDGRLCIGLHECALPGPVVTFAHPELAQHLRRLRSAGLEPHVARLGELDFHELHLRSSAGQDIVLREARTYSPATVPLGESQCGYFSSYSIPALDFDAEQAFWEHAGFVSLALAEEPFVHLPLISDHLNLMLHRPRTVEAPLLVFTDPQMSARIVQLRQQQLRFSDELPRQLSRSGNALLVAPEGTLLALLEAEL